MYAWDERSALVQTVDFFTPVVDDPATYGAIAAANALSDVYAMGGRPLTALAIAGFPQVDVDEATIRAIFLGGFEKLREAGVALLGGHTVQDREIKFGYAVAGVVSREAVWSNAGARPGDVLFLTKPIGTGVIATAIKFDRAQAANVDAAVAAMLRLNKDAAEALLTLPTGAVHACTDVTGFGLIGHVSEVAVASRVTVVLDAERVPVMPGVREIVATNRAGGMKSNEDYFGRSVNRGTVPEDLVWLLYDPQTSGGLLASVSQARAADLERELIARDVLAARIGRVEAFHGVAVELH